MGVVALGLIWFLSSIALLLVALAVGALAFHEYEHIVDKIGAKVPYWTALVATLLACSMVPFQWVDIESVLAAALLLIALNYGGRAEIVDAARRAIRSGIAADDLDERRFGEFLYTSGQPDPDLLIRTSGEMRVSNFLLWQIAYAEIWVTETLWPDFRRRHLLEAVIAYQKRDRRYGGIKPSPVALGVK